MPVKVKVSQDKSSKRPIKKVKIKLFFQSCNKTNSPWQSLTTRIGKFRPISGKFNLLCQI